MTLARDLCEVTIDQRSGRAVVDVATSREAFRDVEPAALQRLEQALAPVAEAFRLGDLWQAVLRLRGQQAEHQVKTRDLRQQRTTLEENYEQAFAAWGVPSLESAWEQLRVLQAEQERQAAWGGELLGKLQAAEERAAAALREQLLPAVRAMHDAAGQRERGLMQEIAAAVAAHLVDLEVERRCQWWASGERALHRWGRQDVLDRQDAPTLPAAPALLTPDP